MTGAKVKEKYGNAELNYKYDARGNLIYERSSLDGKSFINEYSYDGNNFLDSFKYKNGNKLISENTYNYTNKGQLENVYFFKTKIRRKIFFERAYFLKT